MKFVLLMFTLLTACAPVGQPADAPVCPKPIEKPEPVMPDVKKYYECGKAIECGMWCNVSEECREIEKEMDGGK